MLKVNNLVLVGPISTLHFKLCKLDDSKHRIFHLNCLFNNYKVVIQRSKLFNTISMLKANTHIEFEKIPTLHLAAMRG